MTHIEPGPSPSIPEMPPPDTPGPDIDPAGAPDEVPPLDPGDGHPPDSPPSPTSGD